MLLASNIPGTIDEIVNGLVNESSNIVAKELDSDTDGFIESVKKALLQRTYDMSIIVPDDHVKALILLNREPEINAAICSSEDDLKSAESNNVNVIVLKSNELRSSASIITSVIGGKAPKKMAGLWNAIKPGHAKPAEQRATPQPRPRPEPAASTEERPEPQRRSATAEKEKGYNGKGLVKKLKYSFGLED